MFVSLLASSALAREIIAPKIVDENAPAMGSDEYWARVQRKRQTDYSEVFLTKHFTPDAASGCPTDASTIDQFDSQYAKCCGAGYEQFIAIEEPANQCLTQDGVKFYEYQVDPTNSSKYQQCTYAGDDIEDGDVNCVLASKAVCVDSAVLLDTCSLVYSSISGELQSMTDPDATATWTMVSKVNKPAIYSSDRPSRWERREYSNTLCTGTYTVLIFASDACQAAESAGVASSDEIFVEYNNQYNPVTNFSKYCLYHSSTCGKYDRPDDVNPALLVPFLCREYEVGKCENDGFISQQVSITYVDGVCDATVDPDGCMPGTGSATSIVLASSAILATLVAMLV